MLPVQIDLTQSIPERLLAGAKYIEQTLEKHGFEAYLVGGSVRDLLLEKKISDLDYTTNATPDKIKSIFPKTIPVGEEFGTILVLYRHIPFEVTTYRHEGEYTDGRRPEKIIFGHSLEEDVLRRDFTINGMAYHIGSKKLIDYAGGREDIEKKLIKTIGDPNERFREDGLRPIRGCRIMANLGFSIDPNTKKAMSKNLDVVAKIAHERFYDEWKKTLKIKDKRTYWDMLKETGIFSLFFPGFRRLLENQTQWELLQKALESTMVRNMAIYNALFFYFEHHNLSESEVYTELPPSWPKPNIFMEHFLRENRFPMKLQKLSLELVKSPLLHYLENNSQIDYRSSKRVFSKITRENWFSHIRFASAVYHATGNHRKKEIGTIVTHLRELRHNNDPYRIKDLAVNGHHLSSLNLKGKEIGEALEFLLEKVIQSPSLNTKEQLIELVTKEFIGR